MDAFSLRNTRVVGYAGLHLHALSSSFMMQQCYSANISPCIVNQHACLPPLRCNISLPPYDLPARISHRVLITGPGKPNLRHARNLLSGFQYRL